MTHYVLVGLGILIAVLTVVAALGLLPSLRIVPDDTHFDFTRFRRISFPISAALSILAIHATGDAISPSIVAAASDRIGLQKAIQLVPIALGLGALIWLFAWRTLPEKPRSES